GGIEIHAQIVVVPGHNDGPILQQTLNDLEHLAAAIRSVAIVPVGLTRHREGLHPLRLPDEAEAAAVIAEVAPRQKACLARHGRRLHFLADEFYLLGGQPLPAAAEYEGYPQIENGVGMVRRFEEDHAPARRLIPWPRGAVERAGASRGGRPRVLVATGERFAPLLAQWLGPKLSSTGEGERFRVETVAVRNEFFGPTVTTAGLLTGGDLLAGLRAAGEADLALIPPETLDGEGRLLDDQTPEGLSEALGIPVSAGFHAPPAGGRRRAAGER
ncbi:MAG: DUF512 domain-containing protein, partial [Candidatus Eisenbacteria bacterium]|nr:DUF512 domain-containing protein [Candidatus Eisenbacteria bacterium]